MKEAHELSDKQKGSSHDGFMQHGQAVTGTLHPPIERLGKQNSKMHPDEPVHIPDTKQQVQYSRHVCKPMRALQLLLLCSIPQVRPSRKTRHPTKIRLLHIATYSHRRAVRPSKSPSGRAVRALPPRYLCVSTEPTMRREEATS